jgi:hypothetical protein
MKVSVSLAFEEGDAHGELVLHFADGSTQVLSHEASQVVVDIACFEPIPFQAGGTGREPDEESD